MAGEGGGINHHVEVHRGATGAITGGLVLAARRSWLRRSANPVPEAEYLVAVWAISYVALIVIAAGGRTVNLTDLIILSPPFGIVPLAVRTMLGDDGDATGLARTWAYRSHLILGWAHVAAGALAVISLFFLVVAPLQLVPGAFHLRASYLYGVRRRESRS